MMRLYFLLVILILGCTQSSKLGLKELEKYVNDESNGLKRMEKIGDLEVKAIFRPSDFLVEQELDEEEV